MGIDIVVVLNVIFVVGGRDKQGIEVNDLHSQILEIVQLLHDALQVTSVEAPHVHGRRVFIPVLHMFHRFSDIDVLSVFHIVGWISIAETVHKDLVHDRALGPVGSTKSRSDLELILLDLLPGGAKLVIIPDFLPGAHPEAVVQILLTQLQGHCIVVKHPGCAPLLHLVLSAARQQADTVRIACSGAELQCDLLSWQWFRRENVISCSVAK